MVTGILWLAGVPVSWLAGSGHMQAASTAGSYVEQVMEAAGGEEA